MMKQLLATGLPLLHTFHKWDRLFSILRDGSSFHTFLANVKKSRKTLAVIETNEGKVFGFYAGETWKNRVGSAAFYGNGESFLWKLDEVGNVVVYKWTGGNSFFQLCDATKGQIAMGGGGGGEFGVCVDDDFMRGTSGACGTFGNEGPLSDEPCFDVINFEVYGFVGEL